MTAAGKLDRDGYEIHCIAGLHPPVYELSMN